MTDRSNVLRWRFVLAVAVGLGAAVLTSVVMLDALAGAGLTGTAPAGASAFQRLISTLTDNWKWLIATGLGLVLTIIAGMMMVGSRTAPDWLFKVIGGIVLILVVIPGVLA